MLKHDGHCLLFDPYLSESLTTKYANSDKPHVRMTRRPIDPVRLDMIDVVTSSHDHTDHFDAATLRPLKEVNPQLRLVLPAANRRIAMEKLQTTDDWFVPLNDSDQAKVAGFHVRAVPAAHESLDRDDAGWRSTLATSCIGEAVTRSITAGTACRSMGRSNCSSR